MADRRTQIGDFANIFKAFIGTNYLSLPYGFLISGLGFGVIGLLVVAFFTDYSCIVMVRCKYHMIDSVCEDYTNNSKKSSSTSKTDKKVAQLRSRLGLFMHYGDLVRLVFGKWGIYLVNFCIIVTQAGFCMNYFIVIGNTMQTLFPLEAALNTSEAWLPLNSSSSSNLTVNAFVQTYDLNPKNTRQMPSEVLLNDLETVKPATPGELYTGNTQSEIYSTTFNSASRTNGTVSTSATPATDVNSTTTSSNPPSYRSTSPPLPLLVLLPLPILILFTYFRTVRQLSIVSVIANTCSCVGFLSAVLYLVVDFKLSDDLEWWIPSGLLVYIGQATGAFEAVALILPIEASMVGNRHLYPSFLHGAVALMTFIIAVMAVIGYLSYGPATQQIILLNLPPAVPVTVAISVLLIVAIVCTYPLMIVPVIQIMENALFGEKSMSNSEIRDIHTHGPQETSPLVSSASTEVEEDDSYDDPFQLSIAYHIPSYVPAWKRNLFRTLVTLIVCGMAVLLRNVLAYSLAFVGALGSCPLAYIIPGALYLKLRYTEMTKFDVCLNVIMILFGCVFCVVGVVLAMKNMIEKA